MKLSTVKSETRTPPPSVIDPVFVAVGIPEQGEIETFPRLPSSMACTSDLVTCWKPAKPAKPGKPAKERREMTSPSAGSKSSIVAPSTEPRNQNVSAPGPPKAVPPTWVARVSSPGPPLR